MINSDELNILNTLQCRNEHFVRTSSKWHVILFSCLFRISVYPELCTSIVSATKKSHKTLTNNTYNLGLIGLVQNNSPVLTHGHYFRTSAHDRGAGRIITGVLMSSLPHMSR